MAKITLEPIGRLEDYYTVKLDERDVAELFYQVRKQCEGHGPSFFWAHDGYIKTARVKIDLRHRDFDSLPEVMLNIDGLLRELEMLEELGVEQNPGTGTPQSEERGAEEVLRKSENTSPLLY